MTPIQNRRDESLYVRRLQWNDAAAYDALVRDYQNYLLRLSIRMTGSVGDADDTVQDIFIKVFRNIHAFRGEATLKTWISRIAVSEILNRQRWHQRRPWHATVPLGNAHVTEPEPSPDRVLRSKEVSAAVHAALAAISVDHRSILVLREIEGFSYADIAGATGIRTGTVKSRLARAKAALKAALLPLGIGSPAQL